MSTEKSALEIFESALTLYQRCGDRVLASKIIESAITEERSKREEAEKSRDLALAGCADLRSAMENIKYKESDDGDWLLLDNVMLNVSHKGPLIKQNIEKHCRKIEVVLANPNLGQSILDRLNAAENEVEMLREQLSDADAIIEVVLDADVPNEKALYEKYRSKWPKEMNGDKK